MPSDPTKPKFSSITVNRLPHDLVVGFKSLALKLDCNIEDLMQVVLDEAIKKQEGWYPAVYRLSKAKAKARQEQKKVNEQLKEIQGKLEQANVS